MRKVIFQEYWTEDGEKGERIRNFGVCGKIEEKFNWVV